MEFRELLQPALTGLAAGFLFSIPVGPVNLTLINESARRGFGWAMLITAGATLMETIYCAIAFTGFAQIFGQPTLKATLELLSFLLLLWLGWKFLRAREVPAPSEVQRRIEQKLHPHSAFMIGFVRVLANPGVLLLWITATATFVAHDWVEPTGPEKAACIAGVALGNAAWFTLLSWGMSLGRRHFSSKTLIRMEHVSGLIMLGAALVIGGKIVLLLRENHWKMQRPSFVVPPPRAP